MFHLPLREINERFTKSELFISAWRSQEVSYQMRKKMKSPGPEVEKDVDLPTHFYNEQGEIDLRKVKGEEARRYLTSLGLDLPILPRNN